MRIKNAYIIAQCLPGSSSFTTWKDFTTREIQQVLREKITELYGDIGMAEAGSSVLVKYLDGVHTRLCIIR